MEVRKVITEETSLTLALWFKDENDTPVLPESFTYNLVDELTGVDLIAETTITPVLANPYILTIPVSVNVIHTPGVKIEPKVFSIKYVYNSGTQGASKEFKYNVKNLSYI